MKDHILHDSIHVKYLEKANPQNRKKIGGCQGLGGRRGWEAMANGYGVSLGGDENVLLLDSNILAIYYKPCKYTKMVKIAHFKGVHFVMYELYNKLKNKIKWKC